MAKVKICRVGAAFLYLSCKIKCKIIAKCKFIGAHIID